MKTFKKALSIILGVAIMLSCLFGMQVSVAAEETETPANPLAIGVGEVNVADGVVTVPVEVINNPGFITLSVIVGYNNEELQLTNSAKVADFATVAAPGNDVPSEVGEISPDFKEINWAYVSDEDVTATGTIATFTFEVLDETLASTDITLEVDEASNAADEDVTATAEGTTVVLKDEPVVPPVCEEHTGEWTVVTPATSSANGSKTRTCTTCGEVETAVIPQIIKPATRSLVLASEIGVSYKVNASYFDTVGYTDPYAVFTMNGKATTVDYTIEESTGRYVFTYNTIPQLMNDEMHIEFFAYYDGELYAGETRDFKVTDYCYSQLSSTSDSKFKTLLVDLLNYGTAAQQYKNHNLENLANAELTAEQAAWGTADKETPAAEDYRDIHDSKYEVLDNAPVTWKTLSLILDSAVVVKLGFTIDGIDDLSNVKLVATNNKTTWEIPASEFYKGTGSTADRYYVDFSKLAAHQMDDAIYYKLYNGETVISNTWQHSIESYVSRNVTKSTNSAALINLLIQMMDYGYAADAYNS